eukprot:350179_1
MEPNEPIESNTEDEVEMESLLNRMNSIDSKDDHELHRVDISDLQANNNDQSPSYKCIEEEHNRTSSAMNTASHANNPAYAQSRNIKSPKPTTYVSAAVNIDGQDMHSPHSIHRSTPRTNPVDTEHHIRFKCAAFLVHAEILGRILLLILNVLLLMLSAAYCMGQLYGSTLDLVKECDGQAIEDIWEHSYEAGLMDNGEVKLTIASQWGITSEPCWTTKKLDTNTDPLWYSNVYVDQPVDQPVNMPLIGFGLLTLYCLYIMVYNIYSVITDCVHASRNELHKTSQLYQHFMENQNKTNTAIHGESCLRRASRYSSALWSKYMGDHTTGWIVRGVISETMEILIQTQALFLYNGYNMWDRHNDEIYIANQSHFIVWFAVILAFNSVGSGVLWCSYALLTKYCHGLLFKLLLFCVDEFSDLFYTLFPFLMILFDDYNHDKQNMRVLLAQLNTHSTTVAFVSAFMPLVLLGSKSLFLIRSAQTELADRYYSHWKLVYDISTQKDDKQASYQAQLAGRHVNTAALQKNKEIFDSTGNLVLTMNKTVTGRRNWIQSKTKDTISRKKQCILVAIALVYMIYGVAMLSYVINHVHQAEQYCNLIEESNYFEDGELNINSTELSKQQHELLQSNPELFFWNKCLYKVYPFLGNGVKYRHACQCRVLVIDWSETMSTAYDRNTYFNLTQPIILSSMLKHWFQLEKFRTNQKELTSSLQGTPITKEMFIAKHMKAFEWTFAKIGCIAQGISEWKQLEYLKLQHASLPFGIPNDFDGLESMKYLSFEENGLPAFPDSICSLTSLEFLDIQLEANIKSIHPCISNLTQLKQLTIENCILMEEIPLPVFNLSNLVILSLFNNLISLQSLIQYNDKNDV